MRYAERNHKSQAVIKYPCLRWNQPRVTDDGWGEPSHTVSLCPTSADVTSDGVTTVDHRDILSNRSQSQHVWRRPQLLLLPVKCRVNQYWMHMDALGSFALLKGLNCNLCLQSSKRPLYSLCCEHIHVCWSSEVEPFVKWYSYYLINVYETDLLSPRM